MAKSLHGDVVHTFFLKIEARILELFTCDPFKVINFLQQIMLFLTAGNISLMHRNILKPYTPDFSLYTPVLVLKEIYEGVFWPRDIDVIGSEASLSLGRLLFLSDTAYMCLDVVLCLMYNYIVF